MALKVLQGNLQAGQTSVPDLPANEVPIDGVVEFRDTNHPNLPPLRVPKATVFVNERGRNITVGFFGPGPLPTVFPPRDSRISVVLPRWHIQPHRDNVPEDRVDQPFRAGFPQQPQTGTSVTFKTSLCGLDTYQVSHFGIEPEPFIFIEVRKRIRCQYFEMDRPNPLPAPEGPTFNELRPHLQRARDFFADNFGIDLTFSQDAIQPDRTLSLQPPRTQNQLDTMLPPQNQRQPRELFILAVRRITPPEVGWGGRSMAAVSIQNWLDELQSNRQWVAGFAQFQRQQGRIGGENDFLNQQGVQDPGVRRFLLQLLRGLTTPESVFNKGLFSTLLHEIGHALGLVPTNEMAGGMDQSPWRDGAHQNHCNTDSCVMWWEAELAQQGFQLRIGEETPFDHSMDLPTRCTLYLFACDLSDIRHFPQ
ncbi:MAG: hypothetical protein L0Y74_07715 [candidate division Zixibacteria bacterium]|nr:hypothetical protein [candidate division Zixibacteria bacterium]MCI0531816.1 hypothetical protein [candidate division Zixibacteria bacterium]